MHATQTSLKIGPVPIRLQLRRGQVLTCTAGCLWITSDALAGRRDSDVVLRSGQFFVTPQAADYFVGAPRGSGELSFFLSNTPVINSLETSC
jgi:hypothetical protein